MPHTHTSFLRLAIADNLAVAKVAAVTHLPTRYSGKSLLARLHLSLAKKAAI
jgi:hypothetical protein